MRHGVCAYLPVPPLISRAAQFTVTIARGKLALCQGSNGIARSGQPLPTTVPAQASPNRSPARQRSLQPPHRAYSIRRCWAANTSVTACSEDVADPYRARYFVTLTHGCANHQFALGATRWARRAADDPTAPRAERDISTYCRQRPYLPAPLSEEYGGIEYGGLPVTR